MPHTEAPWITLSVRRSAIEAEPTRDTYPRVDEVIADEQRVLVTGGPGAGKSTLLRWLAARAARQDFDGALGDWNGTAVVHLPARRLAAGPLPPPGELRQLRRGAGLVLLDGVDAVPEHRRGAVRDWIVDLVRRYPACRCLVTSRPAAVPDGWLDAAGFAAVDLQPMTATEIRTFVGRWYAAEPGERTVLDRRRDALLARIGASLDLQRLATTPLHCALLCALGAAGLPLPGDRVGLYRAALESGRAHQALPEYVAARGIVDRGDAGSLPARAHDDGWHEIVVLAAGLCGAAGRDELIGGLLDRGEREPALRRRMSRLAVACLGTAGELGPEVAARVDRCLAELVPPRTVVEARELAAAGARALPRLALHPFGTAAEVATCVRATSLIGGEVALDVLAGYANDPRTTPRAELVRAWSQSWDPAGFARRVLAGTPLAGGQLRLTDPGLLPGVLALPDLRGVALRVRDEPADLELLSRVPNLVGLDLAGCRWVDDLGFLADAGRLRVLDLAGTAVRDLEPLRPLAGLRELDLTATPVTDLDPVAALPRLARLSVRDCRSLATLAPLAALDNVAELDASGCPLTDLAPLVALPRLTTLYLDRCDGLTDLTPLRGLTGLTRLQLRACTGLTDFSPLAALHHLDWLQLANCPGLTSLSFVTGLPELSGLHLTGTAVRDLTPLLGLTQLGFVSLPDGIPAAQVESLAALPNLWRVLVGEVDGTLDLAAFAATRTHPRGLQIVVSRTQQVTGGRSLASAGVRLLRDPEPQRA
jgi:hypothetical protein